MILCILLSCRTLPRCGLCGFGRGDSIFPLCGEVLIFVRTKAEDFEVSGVSIYG
jgi:hypothetical protein